MIILYILLAIILSVPLVGKLLSTKAYKGPLTDHFNGKRFQNLSRISAHGFDKVSKYMRESQKIPWPKYTDVHVYDKKISNAPDAEVRYLFVNHSTFLLQIGGINILTDPIFSDYCSPLPIPRFKRNRPAGISLENLPKIDLVLLSHNHYDHMDKSSIKQISKKWNPQFITSLGNAPILKKYGAKRVIEMDWWEEIEFSNIKITSTPCNHFSSRGMFDRNTSLWCGFVLAYAERKIYFLGDSGYGDIFREIGERYGPMDLSMIPIGAYKPRWFMGPIHVSPEESIKVHFDVKSKKSIAMHFGTFALADDNPEEAKEELALVKRDYQIDDQVFQVLEEGRLETL